MTPTNVIALPTAIWVVPGGACACWRAARISASSRRASCPRPSSSFNLVRSICCTPPRIMRSGSGYGASSSTTGMICFPEPVRRLNFSDDPFASHRLEADQENDDPRLLERAHQLSAPVLAADDPCFVYPDRPADSSQGGRHAPGSPLVLGAVADEDRDGGGSRRDLRGWWLLVCDGWRGPGPVLVEVCHRPDADDEPDVGERDHVTVAQTDPIDHGVAVDRGAVPRA